MKRIQNQSNHNLSALVEVLYYCLAPLKYCIKIRLTQQQLQCNLEQNKLNDVQKYYNDIFFDIQTQCQILQDILRTNLNRSQTDYLPYLEKYFLAFMNKGINNLEQFQEQLEKFYEYFKNQFLLQRNAVLNFKPFVVEIMKNSEKQQQQLRLQNQLFQEVLELLKVNINDNFKMMESIHIDDIIKIIRLIQQFINKNLNFTEDQSYWLLFNKIRFQIQLFQIFSGDNSFTNYSNEVFLFNFKDWKNKLCDGSFFVQFNFVDMKYRDQIYRGLKLQISDQNLIQDQLESFFQNKEIINLMEQAQEKLELSIDSSLNFLLDIKFVVNPDEYYFCETIRDFGIIINLFQMIELYKGQLVDNIEFRQVILAYITVITIQGWTQLQLLKLNNKKILTYDKNTDQKDQQFILNHLIFGKIDGKSNLKAINKQIAEQINSFQSVERLQQFLTQQYSIEGQLIEEI